MKVDEQIPTAEYYGIKSVPTMAQLLTSLRCSGPATARSISDYQCCAFVDRKRIDAEDEVRQALDDLVDLGLATRSEDGTYAAKTRREIMKEVKQ